MHLMQRQERGKEKKEMEVFLSRVFILVCASCKVRRGERTCHL